MKILFWFNGSGGQRRERKVANMDLTYLDEKSIEIIESDLSDWVDSLKSNSSYKRWGWDENFDEKTLEPLSKK